MSEGTVPLNEFIELKERVRNVEDLKEKVRSLDQTVHGDFGMVEAIRELKDVVISLKEVVNGLIIKGGLRDAKLVFFGTVGGYLLQEAVRHIFK